MKQFGFMGKMVLTAAAALILLPAAGMYGQSGLFQSQGPKGPWANKSLSPDERAEYQLFVEIGDLVALLQAKARGFLAEQPQG